MCLVLKVNKEKPRSLGGFGVCVLAEGEGFEPSIRNFRMPPFQGGTFNHSATLPRWSELTVSSESAIVQYIFKVV